MSGTGIGAGLFDEDQDGGTRHTTAGLRDGTGRARLERRGTYVTVSRRLGRGVEAFASAENLLDRRFLVGRAGVDTVGAPRLLRAGLRLRAGAARP